MYGSRFSRWERNDTIRRRYLRLGPCVWSIALLVALALACVSPPLPISAGINVWTGIGPAGGNVSALALAPSNPNVVYLGSETGGVYKSINGGASWSAANTGLANTPVNALAIDPANPSVLYAGTSYGVYKSINGGAAWSESTAGLGTSTTNALVINPITHSILYAGTSFGVYKSIDSGVNWSAVNNGLVNQPTISALAIHPAAPDTLYAAADNGLYKTVDGGANWSPLVTGQPANTAFYAVVINPAAPATVFAATSTDLLRSTNNGADWGVIRTTTSYPLAIAPSNSDIIYAGGGGGIARSANGGTSWSIAATGLTDRDVRALAIHSANPAIVYAGTSGGGVFKTTTSGGNWSAANSGFVHTWVTSLAVTQTTPATLFAGTTGGVFRSTDGGGNWQVFNQGLSTFVQTLAIDPATPTTLYAGTSFGVYKSVDNGVSWASNGPEQFGLSLDTYAVAVDPITPTTIYAAGSREFTPFPNGIYMSTSGGAGWSSFNSGLTNLRARSLAIDPVTTTTLYAGTTTGVFKRTAASGSWAAAGAGMPASVSVYDLEIDPADPNTIFAASSAGIYKSTNGATSWTEVFATSAGDIAIDPDITTTIYASGGESVYRSVDGGMNWSPFNVELPDGGVGTLAIDPLRPNNIYAGSAGRGAFALTYDHTGAPYARVLNERRQPVVGALVYRNGKQVTDSAGRPMLTDAAGIVALDGLKIGDRLAALALQYTRPSGRGDHQGWAYRVYTTNMDVDSAGNVHPYVVAKPEGKQELIVKTDQTLMLFNLVISVEWDASAAYLGEIVEAADRAADFLYDVTDGQMTFGQVAIYDNAEKWASADIQISAKNIVDPHANVGGLTDRDPSHIIRVGRYWDGNTGNSGPWNAANGYRTLVHEFGHYGLGLYDEYFGYQKIGNQLGPPIDAYCLDQTSHKATTPSREGASIMDNHYAMSELADVGRWSDDCRQTAQHQRNEGQADWQTVVQRFRDSGQELRWRLITPDQGAGLGKAVAGPDTIPPFLPFPSVAFINAGINPAPILLTLCQGGSLYTGETLIALDLQNGKVIDQGVAKGGSLLIFGARPNDTLRALTTNGKYVGDKKVFAQGCLNLSPVNPKPSLASEADLPYLRMWPTTGNGQLDGVQLVLTGTLPDDDINYAVTGADDIGPSAAMPYSAATGDHRVMVGFIPASMTGHAKALGEHASQYFNLNVDYRLYQTSNISDTTLFSNDGNMKLFVESGSLPYDKLPFLIASPWGMPGAAPSGLRPIGDLYEITAATSVITLTKPAVLRLHYDAALGTAFEQLAIYRWDFAQEHWQRLGGTIDAEHHEVAILTRDLGLYTLMGATAKTYLPLIKR